MSPPLILVERRSDGVAIVRLDNPKVNALSKELLSQLTAVADGLRDDPPGAVVFTGGDRIFAAGAEISEFRSTEAPAEVITRAEAELIGQQFLRALNAVADIPRATIAAISGFALGGGCELAMACTIRIAADTARLGQPEINLGIIPGYAGTQRLARLIGRGRALEMLLTGEHVMAPEAHRLGLVNRVVPAAELMTEARKLAATLAAKAPVAARYIIDAVNKGLDMGFADAQVFEATLFGLVSTTEDMREGTRAFLEKRKAEFTGK